MPYRFLLFDLDDTLYPPDSGLWDVLGERILQFMTERLGLPPAEVRRRRETYFARYGTTLAGLMADFPDMDPDEYLAFVHAAPLEEYLRPNPALAAVLQRTPLRKVVFTNADEAHSRRVLACLGLAEHFERIIDIRALEFMNKPRPEAYDRALAILSAAPAECIIVEDLVRNLRPAKSLGMTTVLVGADGSAPQAGVDFQIGRVEEVGAVLEVLATSPAASVSNDPLNSANPCSPNHEHPCAEFDG